MPAPQAIFIDTGILDHECYDFGSARIQSLLTAAKSLSKKLILPQPTALEIDKHIHEKSRLAVASLMKARETHALLRGITGVPQSRVERDKMIEDIRSKVMGQWASFKATLDCQELDHDGVKVAEVMDWYANGKPPFGPGEKQKEFPDAFALAAIRAYALQSSASVAVVSMDNDFKKFCATSTVLRYYPDLDTLTSELVADAHERRRFAQAVALAEAAIPALITRIKAEFPNRGFWHELAPVDENEEVENVIATNCTLERNDLQVVGISPEQLTVSFRAEVAFTADVSYADSDSWQNLGDGELVYHHRCEGNVADTAVVHGSAHVDVDPEAIEGLEICDFKIDESYIWVREPAPQAYDDYSDYQ